MPKVIETRADGSKKVVTVNNEPSKTDPSWKDEVNAENIIKKFKTTGQITHLAKKAGSYADCSTMQDLHASLLQVEEAKKAFGELPSQIRKRFNNDYKELALFQCDSQNIDEMIEIGLVEPPPNYISPKDLKAKQDKELAAKSAKMETTKED